MTIYMIAYGPIRDGSRAFFVDSLELGAGPDPRPNQLVAGFEASRDREFYRYWDFPPEFAYFKAGRTEPDPYFVYRETDGGFLFAGFVGSELIRPGIADAQSGLCPECGAAGVDEADPHG